MGLLDSLLYDSGSYGGQGGGLLDFLRTSQMQQNNYQPSAGFPNPAPAAPSRFDAATFDPSTYAPSQPNNPIAVGGYQMPRMGNPDQFQPQQAMMPPNAQPTQGQGTPQAPQQPQQPAPPESLPPALGGQQGGFLNNLSAGLQSIGNGGSILGAITGNRTDPQSIAQQNLGAQYQAVRQTLQSSGMSPQEASSKAMLAVMNTEAGKTILTEALTNKEKYGVVSEDPLGGKQYGFVNEREQTINGKPIGSAGSPAGQAQGLQAMTDRISQMRESGASKEQLLGQIPTGYRDDVNALITGKGVPANMGRAQSRMAILTLAKVVDPNFDETMIPTRIAMRKDFSGEGKNGQAIGSFNTAQHHIDKLSDDLEELSKYNGNFPSLNAARGWLANNANTNPKLRDSMQAVNDDMAAVSHEVANAYNSGHLSDHDMATWNKLTHTDLPPDQLRRGISDFVDLLNGKRDSLNHMYHQAFGEDAPTIEKDKNAAITSKVHQRLPEYAKNRDSNAAPATSGLPSGWSVQVH